MSTSSELEAEANRFANFVGGRPGNRELDRVPQGHTRVFSKNVAFIASGPIDEAVMRAIISDMTEDASEIYRQNHDVPPGFMFDMPYVVVCPKKDDTPGVPRGTLTLCGKTFIWCDHRLLKILCGTDEKGEPIMIEEVGQKITTSTPLGGSKVDFISAQGRNWADIDIDDDDDDINPFKAQVPVIRPPLGKITSPPGSGGALRPTISPLTVTKQPFTYQTMRPPRVKATHILTPDEKELYKKILRSKGERIPEEKSLERFRILPELVSSIVSNESPRYSPPEDAAADKRRHNGKEMRQDHTTLICRSITKTPEGESTVTDDAVTMFVQKFYPNAETKRRGAINTDGADPLIELCTSSKGEITMKIVFKHPERREAKFLVNIIKRMPVTTVGAGVTYIFWEMLIEEIETPVSRAINVDRAANRAYGAGRAPPQRFQSFGATPTAYQPRPQTAQQVIRTPTAPAQNPWGASVSAAGPSVPSGLRPASPPRAQAPVITPRPLSPPRSQAQNSQGSFSWANRAPATPVIVPRPLSPPRSQTTPVITPRSLSPSRSQAPVITPTGSGRGSGGSGKFHQGVKR
jgi:hypothetical protein